MYGPDRWESRERQPSKPSPPPLALEAHLSPIADSTLGVQWWEPQSNMEHWLLRLFPSFDFRKRTEWYQRLRHWIQQNL